MVARKGPPRRIHNELILNGVPGFNAIGQPHAVEREDVVKASTDLFGRRIVRNVVDKNPGRMT
jgi:hypothetical protein